jgi:hypothetical protein
MYSETNMPVADKLLLDRLTLRETQLSQQADALDAKASMLLVAVTFLAGQTVYLLSNHLDGFVHWEQIVASLAEFIAGCILAWVLRIQWYMNETAEKYPKWRDDLLAEAEFGTDDVEAHMVSEIIEGLTSRCSLAYGINHKKAKVLLYAHWVTLTGLGFNCLALAALSGIRVCFFR